MKKTVFAFAAFVVLGLAANAQSPVYTFGVYSQLPISYIPGAFMANGQPGCATVEVDPDNPVNSSVKMYDSQLRPIGNTLSVPVGIVINGDTREEVYNSVSGQWSLENSERGDNLIRVPVVTSYMEFGNTGIEANSLFLMTQSLFNSDADMEYLTPVTSLVTDTDYHGSARRTVTSKVVATAFNVVKPGGAVVSTISLPDGYVSTAVSDNDVLLFAAIVAKFMGNYYILIPATANGVADSDRYKVFVYSLNPSGGNGGGDNPASLSLVGEGLPMSVFPSFVNRGSEITVELGDNSAATQIRVIDQAGRVVKTVPVQAGQRQVKVSTADVNPGVSFINAICGRQQSSYKVVVQ